MGVQKGRYPTKRAVKAGANVGEIPHNEMFGQFLDEGTLYLWSYMIGPPALS